MAEQDLPGVEGANVKPRRQMDQESTDNDHSADVIPESEVNHPAVAEAEVTVKKKKKKSKSKAGKGATKPTGFEENYADPPVTPAEYQDEQSLYDPSKSFPERVQIAIQRFVARRKFDSERKDVFDKYLAFGGFETGPKQFGGSAPADLRDLTAEEIADLKARHFVSSWVYDKHEVDFGGMLKAFLSSRLPRCIMLERRDQIKYHVHVIRSFLNYLLHHDVCPEYRQQILDARKTCDVGEAQLWLIRESAAALPGDFNKACSMIWGGQYFDTQADENDEAMKDLRFGPNVSPDQANKIFTAGLSIYGSPAAVSQYNEENAAKRTKVVREFETFLEITEMHAPSADVRDFYGLPVLTGVTPLGKLKARTWYCPDAPDEDLTEEEEAAIAMAGRPVETFEFWVEDSLLDKLFDGMKLRATVHELSFGVYYFDTVTACLCSFYTVVPNEDMLGWRAHRYVPPKEDVFDGYKGPVAQQPEDGDGWGQADDDGEGEEEFLQKFEKGAGINIEA